jgi:4a-hydroxytetrahydrobiopterin dehydratase
MEKLTDEKIIERLKNLHGWILEGSLIRRGWIFRDFIDAMTFVNRVAFLAEKRTHHPEICIDYNRVVLKFTTHDINGLSDLDFNLAEEINEMN